MCLSLFEYRCILEYDGTMVSAARREEHDAYPCVHTQTSYPNKVLTPTLPDQDVVILRHKQTFGALSSK